MPDRRWTLTLTLLAVAARVAAVLVLASHNVPDSTYEHGEIAANLLAGKGFSTHFLGADGPTSQQAPVYPVLVAAAYKLGGVGTPASLLILELAQALLGGLLVLSLMSLTRMIAPASLWAPRIAGLIAAVHPTLVYAATHVQVALLAATLLTAVLALAAWTARSGRPLAAIATGLTLGLLTLTDPILALVTPGALWIILAPRLNRAGLRLAATLSLTAAAVIAPWIARNARVHGELVFVKSTFGYAFWQGNCALSQGTDKVVRPAVETTLSRDPGTSLAAWNRTLWTARHVAGYIDDIALTPADYDQLSRLSEPARGRLLFHRAWTDLATQPGRYAQLCARRLGYFLLFDKTNPKTRSPLYRVSHVGLTALALAGLCLAGPPLRRRLAPTLLTFALITLFHTLTITSARFHIPIEPLLALWAAVGLAHRLPGQATEAPSAPPAHHVERLRIKSRRLPVGVLRAR